MVSKQILIFWTRWTARIDCLDFGKPKTGWQHLGRSAYGCTLATLYIYIYIYSAWLLCLYKHIPTYAYNSFLRFQCSNGRSEPFILFSILICAWRPNFTFFWICLLFIKYFTKLLIQRWLLILLFCAATVGSTIL